MPPKSSASSTAAVPRFMQPTGSSTSRQQGPPSSQQAPASARGHLACTPVLNISAKPSAPSASSDSTATSTAGSTTSGSSSKWKASTGGSSPVVFSVITRGSRQATKQPMPPSKPHPTASRISRPPPPSSSAGADTPPKHSRSSSFNSNSSSLSLRSSSRSGGSSSSSRVSSVFGSSGGASTPVLGSRSDSIGTSCGTINSNNTDNCNSLVRVLTFDDVADGPDQHSKGNSSTAARQNSAHAASSASAHPSSTRSLPKSRIPTAPGITPASDARPAAASTMHAAAVSRIPQAAGGVCAGPTASLSRSAAPENLAAAAHGGGGGLELLTAQTWLSEGSSDEELQQLAGDACMASDVPACGSKGAKEKEADSSTRSVGAKQGAAHADDEASSEGGVCAEGASASAALAGDSASAEPGVVMASKHSRSTGVGRAVMLVLLWSVVLLAVGFLAAAVLVSQVVVVVQEPMQAPRKAPDSLWSEYLLEEDLSGLIGRRYTV